MQIMINQTDLPPAGSQASPVQGKDDSLPSAGEHLRGIGKRREHRSSPDAEGPQDIGTVAYWSLGARQQSKGPAWARGSEKS